MKTKAQIAGHPSAELLMTPKICKSRRCEDFAKTEFSIFGRSICRARVMRVIRASDVNYIAGRLGENPHLPPSRKRPLRIPSPADSLRQERSERRETGQHVRARAVLEPDAIQFGEMFERNDDLFARA
jgi:hypothetical protein